MTQERAGMRDESVYGILAAFREPGEVVRAIEELRRAGVMELEAHTPHTVEEIENALGTSGRSVAVATLAGGLFGCFGGFFMQWYASVKDTPLNVGGRPLNSWPAFIPVTFALTILCASLAAVIGMLWFNGLPKPYHPLFNVEGFTFARGDRFFLSIGQRNQILNLSVVKNILQNAGADFIREVPA